MYVNMYGMYGMYGMFVFMYAFIFIFIIYMYVYVHVCSIYFIIRICPIHPPIVAHPKFSCFFPTDCVH